MASICIKNSRMFLRLCQNNVGKRHSGGHAINKHAVIGFRHQTMNDLPLPSGSWQVANNKKQARYNAYLVTSALFFAATVTIGFVTNGFQIEQLRHPPKSAIVEE